MATTAYDRVGAMGGLFAPAFIHGDPVSEEAVNAWNLRNRRNRPVDMWQPPAQAVAATTAADDPRTAVTSALFNQVRPGGEAAPPGYALDPSMDQGITPGPFSNVQSVEDLGPPDQPSVPSYAPTPVEDTPTTTPPEAAPPANAQAAPAPAAPAPVSAPAPPAPPGTVSNQPGVAGVVGLSAAEQAAYGYGVPAAQPSVGFNPAYDTVPAPAVDMAAQLGINDVAPQGVTPVAPNFSDVFSDVSPFGYGPEATTFGATEDTPSYGPTPEGFGAPDVGTDTFGDVPGGIDSFGYSESTDTMGGMQGYDAFGDVGYGDVGYGDVGDEGSADAGEGDAGDAGDGSDGDGDGDGGDY